MRSNALKRRAVLLTVGFVALALQAAPASATTVTLGPQTLVDGALSSSCASDCTGTDTVTLVQAAAPGVTTVAPAAGRIKAWRVIGTLGNMGTLKLIVLNVASPGATSASGLSAAAGNVAGQPNAVDVPIAAGQSVGVSMCRCLSQSTTVDYATATGATSLRFSPGFDEAGQTHGPAAAGNSVWQFNADVVLAPIVTGVNPATGSPAGGTSVTISGQYLDGATGVSFGGVPAQGFTVSSPSSITATAPPGAEFTSVDVVVTGPGGTSPTSAAAQYGYKTPSPEQQVPDTKISLAKIKSKKGKATISFNAVGDETGFECALTKGKRDPKFKPCTSPAKYKKLKEGKYTFAVRALSAAGADPTPATKAIKIKR